MPQISRVLSSKVITRLRQAGFTVTKTSAVPGTDTVTYSGPTGGGKDGVFARLLPRGKADVIRLRRMGMWT